MKHNHTRFTKGNFWIELAQVKKKQAICENESSKQFQLIGNKYYINKPTLSKKRKVICWITHTFWSLSLINEVAVTKESTLDAFGKKSHLQQQMSYRKIPSSTIHTSFYTSFVVISFNKYILTWNFWSLQSNWIQKMANLKAASSQQRPFWPPLSWFWPPLAHWLNNSLNFSFLPRIFKISALTFNKAVCFSKFGSPSLLICLRLLFFFSSVTASAETKSFL